MVAAPGVEDTASKGERGSGGWRGEAKGLVIEGYPPKADEEKGAFKADEKGAFKVGGAKETKRDRALSLPV